MKITVFGAGYVGLVTAACFSEMGNTVVCVDIDDQKVNLLNQGFMPIYEPGLADMVVRNRAAGRLNFVSNVEFAVSHGDVQFIAVGTPPLEDGSADLKHVLDVAKTIAIHMVDAKVIVSKSTVPVGTCEKISATIADELDSRNKAISFHVASNPEFLKEGAAIDDFMRPDRVIIGADEEVSAQILRQLYSPFVRNHDRLIFMSIKSAELTKYAANAMLATRISFMNELSHFAESVGADIEAIRIGIGTDRRIGLNFLYAGCGYGGSCFPKDVRALINSATDAGKDLKILRAVQEANDRQKSVLIDKVVSVFGTDLSGLHFCVWGMAFKPNTDDIREAPSEVIIRSLLNKGATVSAYDPVARENALNLYRADNNVKIFESNIDAANGADAILIVTEWKEFRSPDFDVLESIVSKKIIFDGRNLYDTKTMRSKGWLYHSIGRKF